MNHKRVLHDGGALGILDTKNIAMVHFTGTTRLLVVTTMPAEDLIRGDMIGTRAITRVIISA
jgi:hypothetical protein